MSKNGHQSGFCALTPEEFAREYGKLILEMADTGCKFSKSEMARRLDISRGTFYAYLKDERYVKQFKQYLDKRKPVARKKARIINEAVDKTNKIAQIYDRYEQLWIEAMQYGELEDKRRILRDMVTAIKTEADIKRINVVIAGDYIDNRQVNIIQQMQEWTEEDKEHFFNQFRAEVCPSCPYKLGRVIKIEED